jgi:glycosyltransferase involved in cell wall biosynthesis
MKLLISTYACAPHHGSEHAVGWNWTTEAHRQGNEVWAMASPVHREAIEVACRETPSLGGITWLFPEVTGWPLTPGVEPRWERTYNLLWQIAALRMARKVKDRVSFDVVHHLTWGGVRAPTFLGRLGVPLIVGPIGGGETSPPSLRSGLHAKARLTEFIRNLSNWTIQVNPIVRGGLTLARMIVVKTPETAAILTKGMQAKSICYAELSVQSQSIGQPRLAKANGNNILFVGRLIYWKGAHIAIRALAELAPRLPDAKLTIVGKGPEQARLMQEAARLGISDRITFVPWLPRDQVSAIYDRHDIFLFPSLHDSTGLVVLEALSHGLPVVCLDSGGPRLIVTPQSGSVVATRRRDTAQVAAALADEIAALLNDPARYAAMSTAAIARAHEFILPNRIADFYSRVKRSLGLAERAAGLPEHAGAPRQAANETFTMPPEREVICQGGVS